MTKIAARRLAHVLLSAIALGLAGCVCSTPRGCFPISNVYLPPDSCVPRYFEAPIPPETRFREEVAP